MGQPWVFLLAGVAALSGGCRAGAENASISKAPIIPGSAESVAVAAGLSSPDDVPLPAASDEARAYMVGNGSRIVDMVPVLEPLWRDGAVACASVVEELDRLGSPEALLEEASGAPDAPTQEILVSLHVLAIDLLGSCEETAKFDSLVPAFAWQWAMAERRLQELLGR